MTQPIPARPHLNGNRFHGDDRPLDCYALRDQENAAPPSEAVAAVIPSAADETDALALAATRYLTPTKYCFAAPLAPAPQIDESFIVAETQVDDGRGLERVERHHRNLHTMARGGEMSTLGRKRESSLATLARIVAGIVCLGAQLKRKPAWVETPSADPAKPWTWWEAVGAVIVGLGSVACLTADFYTYWTNLMESGIRTFAENPVFAGFYGALALALPAGLKFSLGRFGRKDGAGCALTRCVVVLMLLCALAAFAFFAVCFRAPGEQSGLAFGTLSGAAGAEAALPHRIFTVLLMVTTGMLSALLGHWLSLILVEHRLCNCVPNPQRTVLSAELHRLQLIEHKERETLGAIEGKLDELRAERDALVDSSANFFRDLQEVARRDAARLARLTQGRAGAWALRGARITRGVGRLAAWAVAGTLALGALTGCGSRPAGPVTRADEVRQTVLALSPGLPREARETLFATAGQWVLDAAPGDRLNVFDARNLKSVCEVAIPNEPFYAGNPRAREREFGPQMAALRAFLLQDDGGNPGGVMLPQFLAVLAQERQAARLTVIVVGSALYANPADPACDMTDGCFPSDGHLAADPTFSPFALKGHDRTLAGAVVHYAYAPADFAATGTPHRAGVERFLALYVQGLGGTLASFSPDLGGVLRAAHDGHARPVNTPAVDPADAKPTMHRVVVRRTETASETRIPAETHGDAARPMLEDLSPEEKRQRAPDSSRVGHLVIGAKWTPVADIDLYAARESGAPELFYGCTRGTDGGVFYKDFADAPASAINGLETVEWRTPVDLRTATCWLNLYGGNVPGGTEVVVRVIADGRRYERTYKVPADNGDRGRSRARREGDPHWVRVDLAEVCGLPPGSL